MDTVHVPRALTERLGDQGTEGLVRLLTATRTDWADDVLTLAGERFERRLGQEISALRVEFSRELGGLRHDVTRELAAVRVEWLRWSFLFWIGQVAATAGLLSFMLHGVS